MVETDAFVTSSNEGVLMDALTISTTYLKMKAHCINFKDIPSSLRAIYSPSDGIEGSQLTTDF